MSDRIPMTRAGYDKIKAQADHLANEEMPIITADCPGAR